MVVDPHYFKVRYKSYFYLLLSRWLPTPSTSRPYLDPTFSSYSLGSFGLFACALVYAHGASSDLYMCPIYSTAQPHVAHTCTCSCSVSTLPMLIRPSHMHMLKCTCSHAHAHMHVLTCTMHTLQPRTPSLCLPLQPSNQGVAYCTLLAPG